VFLPGRRGSLQLDLVAATRERGRLPYRLDGGLPALLRELDAGLPVLVLQNLGFDWLPNWHYAVVTGYDPLADTVFLHSGRQAHRAQSRELFMKTWRRADYWAMVAPPPQRLPASAEPPALLQAVADLEQTGRADTALAVLDLALARWPDQALLHIGAGNLDLEADRPGAARRHYLAALELRPDAVAAWNNLAYALAADGCREGALRAARCAARLVPGSVAVRDTLADLDTRPIPAGRCAAGRDLDTLLERAGCLAD
jgi:tetratricopeptide (TPR) repeat protein